MIIYRLNNKWGWYVELVFAIKNTISRSPYIDGETAARQYHKLDLTLSGYLAEVKGASRSDG